MPPEPAKPTGTMRDKLRPLSLPDQHGRTWLVTGATHGVGREVARAASAAGARVLLTARDRARGEAVREELGDADVIDLDLASQESVRAAAEQVSEDVDVLANVAGAIVPSRQETVDGFELLLATNVLGPFAFTNLLVDRIRDRIVIVGSGAHKAGRIDHDDPHFRRRRWSMAQAYAQSKLADMLWGLELERRLRDRGIGVQLAHPGWAVTNLQNSSPSRLLGATATGVSRLVGQSAADGAQPILVAATADLPAGSYVGPGGRLEFTGAPTLVGRSRVASDLAEARWLWEFGVRETGTDLPR